MEHKTVSKFYESIKSRMLVAEVIERIRAGGKGRRGTHSFSAVPHETNFVSLFKSDLHVLRSA